jgi:1-acyl-sn-glycerol-3-phosphate acyltransferase
MKQILIFPYQLWVWLVFAPYLAFSTLIFAVIALIMLAIFSPKIAGMTCGVIWSRLICYMTPVFVKCRGRENVDKKQSYVIVANHQSVYDIVALYGWLGIDFRWVMKQELRKIPALGYASEKLGHIFIDRSNTKKAMESLENAKEKIKNGTSVIFKTGELGKFKKGAFKMACDLGLPILPVTINGTREIVQTKSLLLYPGKALITVHAPIPTSGKNESELVEEVRLVMEQGLKG